MIKVESTAAERVSQGDIYKDVDYIEYVAESNGDIEISKIVFPYVMVLTQDCDLEQYFSKYIKVGNQDKFLFSAIVAPVYNAQHVLSGAHLEELDLKMQTINNSKTHIRFLQNNEISRYHYLEFPESVPMVSSVIDFKHYFTVHIQYLLKKQTDSFVCKVSELYRESICQRFANFLSRIALP